MKLLNRFRNIPLSIYEELCKPENYLHVLEKKMSYFMLDHDFATYAQSCDGSRDKLAQKIAAEVRSKTYLPGLVRPSMIRAQNKKDRHIFIHPGKDHLVMNVLYRVLTARCPLAHLTYVYSYVPKKSYFHAVRKFSLHIKKHCFKARRDLYVFKSDFKNYFDSIPVDTSSAIWSRLEVLLSNDTSKPAERDYIWSIIQMALRPLIKLRNGTIYQKIVGVSTGGPLTVLPANLYAIPIDSHLSKIKDGFYARYGDDLIFAHHDPEVVQQAIAKLHQIAAELRLSFNTKKSKFYYLTRCGKACDQFPEFKGCSSINFLGHSLFADGLVAANYNDVRELLLNLKRRLNTTSKYIKKNVLLPPSVTKTIEDEHYRLRLRYLVKTANQLLSIDNQISLPILRIILMKSNDRKQLRFIDHQIFLLLAQYTFEEKGRRVLRKLPFKKMLELEKVVSLEQTKNSKARGLWTELLKEDISNIGYYSH